jgi:hypothetical protein
MAKREQVTKVALGVDAERGTFTAEVA